MKRRAIAALSISLTVGSGAVGACVGDDNITAKDSAPDTTVGPEGGSDAANDVTSIDASDASDAATTT